MTYRAEEIDSARFGSVERDNEADLGIAGVVDRRPARGGLVVFDHLRHLLLGRVEQVVGAGRRQREHVHVERDLRLAAAQGQPRPVHAGRRHHHHRRHAAEVFREAVDDRLRAGHVRGQQLVKRRAHVGAVDHGHGSAPIISCTPSWATRCSSDFAVFAKAAWLPPRASSCLA